MNSAEVLEAIKKRHYRPSLTPSCFVFSEVPVWTDETNKIAPNESRRMDAFAVELWRSNKYERTAYEIKVNRNDLIRELANPRKRQAALSVSNRFYFVTPPGLMRLSEVPKETGLMEVVGGRCRIVVKAPFRKVTPDDSFWVHLIRCGWYLGSGKKLSEDGYRSYTNSWARKFSKFREKLPKEGKEMLDELLNHSKQGLTDLQ